ncbi:MAG: hypothetical protein CMB45_05165 [Euryarchaeota archaeon]|nr:hypothetical protein [Euryarchaeota archaeon]MBK38362.1 hypothetical protein [Euryarchaeota archaeon]|tara:strand:+ start:1129 stop:1692 length:564 start_codon:yes stop_codon:yes gene_type:complete
MDDRIEKILADINSLSAIDRARLISRLNGKQRTHISHRSAVPKVIDHLNEHKWITAPVAFNEGYLHKKLSSSEFEKCVLKHIDMTLHTKKVGRVKHYYTDDCSADHLVEKPPFRHISVGMIRHLIRELDLSSSQLDVHNVLMSDLDTYPCFKKADNRPTIREHLIPEMKQYGYRNVKAMLFTKEAKV